MWIELLIEMRWIFALVIMSVVIHAILWPGFLTTPKDEEYSDYERQQLKKHVNDREEKWFGPKN